MIIGFSSRQAMISKIIKKLTRSKASHAYIVLNIGSEKLVLQANQKGVNCEHYNKFAAHSQIISEYELLVDKESEKKMISFVVKQLTKPYDFWAIIGFAWVLLNKSFGRKVKQPFKNRSAYFCSELVISMLQAGNFPLSHLMEQETTSPEDLIDLLDKHMLTKKII